MGKQAEVKQLRAQVRNVVKELLPEVLSFELETALYKKLEDRLKDLEAHVKKTVHEMNERHKDTMGYIVRQASKEPLKKD